MKLIIDEEKINQNICYNLIRFSVGLEDFQDIKNDLDHTLSNI